MFNIKINGRLFQSCVRVMSAIVSETTFVVDKDGMSTKAVDPANAVLSSVRIPKECFSVYEVTDADICVDLVKIVDILGLLEKSDDIAMKINEETYQLDIEIGNLRYTMALLDPYNITKSPQIPALNLPAVFELPVIKYAKAIKASEMVGSHMLIGMNDDGVYMRATDGADEVNLDVVGDDIVITHGGDVSGLYAIDYLTDIRKGIGSADSMQISLGTDMPLVIDFSPAPDCDAVYILAPRIEGN